MGGVAVVAIVRDEATVIERMLRSAAQICDMAVIVDTGSTDNTVGIMDDVCRQLHLELLFERRPWVDFATNRTYALGLAERSGAKWLLLLDAEQTIELDGKLPDLGDIDAYMVPMKVGGLHYSNPKLIRATRWRFVGAAHEYLDTSGHRLGALNELTVVDHLDSNPRPAKMERNRILLEQALREVPGDPRTIFYLAETYRDLGRPSSARRLYRRRARMDGWEEEGWYAHWQWGSLTADLDQAAPILLAAWERRPGRAEPLYDLGRRYRQAQRYQAAYVYLSHAAAIERSADILFIHAAVYDYLIAFELAIAAWWTGRRDEALGLNRGLLEQDIPGWLRAGVEANLSY